MTAPDRLPASARKPAAGRTPFAPPPCDPHVAARRLADYVVLATAPEVPLIAADYWELSVPAYRKVNEAVRELVATRSDAAGPYARLSRDPGDETAYRELAAAFTSMLAGQASVLASVTELLAQADPTIWIDHVMGARFTSRVGACDLAVLRSLPAPPPRPVQSPQVRVNVIIPFRDPQPGGRTRNLLACLRALRDQDLSPASYRVTVVETDDQPRVRASISGLSDGYIFGFNPFIFNKSWAVNLGLRDNSTSAELTCVLDADILVERSFLRVNAARLSGPHDAHLPYQHMYSLDEPSSAHAIDERLGLHSSRAGSRPAGSRPAGARTAGAAHVDAGGLRGLLLRETPGACLWARTELVAGLGGFDERFEGWGGEDDDVVARLRRNVRLVRYDDQLLHLSHPRPAMTHADGTLFNAHLADAYQADPWDAATGFGDPDRYRKPGQSA
jgi:hypothetical protein